MSRPNVYSDMFQTVVQFRSVPAWAMSLVSDPGMECYLFSDRDKVKEEKGEANYVRVSLGRRIGNGGIGPINAGE